MDSSDEENYDPQADMLSEDNDDDLYEPPKKKRRTSTNHKSTKSTTRSKSDEKVDDVTSNNSGTNSNDKNKSKNTNKNNNKNKNKSNSNADTDHKNNDENNNTTTKEKSKLKLKLKTIQKNAFYYKIGPRFTFHGSTKMEFKVLFASQQICIRLSDLSESEYRNGIRRATGPPIGLFGLLGGGGFDFVAMSQSMIRASRYMDQAKNNQTIQRIFIKFDDINYLRVMCQDEDIKDKGTKTGHIVIKIETNKAPEIKYQKNSGKRSGYTNVSKEEANDLTNGNCHVYSFHEITLSQKNGKVLNAMIDAMKKHPTLDALLTKSADHSFDKNKIIVKSTNENDNKNNKNKNKKKNNIKSKGN